MKTFSLWLHDGTCITVKGKTYDELLSNIDIVIDKMKDATTYYLGYSDETIIQELQDEEVDIEVDENA